MIKSIYNKLLIAFQQKVKDIQQATQVDKNESIGQRKRRKKKLLADYGAFCKYYFPHYCIADAAPFHINLANELAQDPQAFLVKKWARSLAKSTNAAIMIPCWLMLRGDLKFMVLASNTETNAVGLLSDLQAELEANQRLIHDFGEFQRLGSWGLGDFKTKQGVRFKAIGRRQSPRGLRNGQHRPDLILLDDLDDDELVKNPKLVRLSAKWAITALFGCFSAKGGRFVAVGNLIDDNSVLKKLEDNPKSKVEQVNLLDEDGEPTWDYYSKEECLNMIETMGYVMSQREYFNNPIKEGTIYKEEYFQYKKALPLNDYDALVCYTDPSFKSSSKNDFKATVLIGKTGHEYHLLKAYVKQTSVSKMIDWHYKIMKYANGQGNINYYIEANFTQDQHLKNFEDEAKRRGLAVPIRPDKRKKPNKHGRIEAMSPYFEKGYFFVDVREWDNPHIVRLIDQFTTFENGSKAPDDAPDAVEGAIFILNERTGSIKKPTIIKRQKSSSKYRY